MRRTGLSSSFSVIWRNVWPVLVAMLLLVLALLADTLSTVFCSRFLTHSQIQSYRWILFFAGHTGMLLVSLILIFMMSGGNPRRFGLRYPADKTYLPAALAWGVLFGLIMTVIDYLPNLRHHIPPGIILSPLNIFGWLSFEGLFSGTSEEILFRGLLVSYLMTRLSGRIRIGSFDLHVAGLIVALLFCLAHIGSFFARPSAIAMGQQIYAFVWAIFYAYWFEKSGSVLAPAVGHNVGNFVEYCLVFLMAWFWR